MGYLDARLRAWRVIQLYTLLASEIPSMYMLNKTYLTYSAQLRSAEAVQERLDRLIHQIYKLQTPHMDGKSGDASDILIVRTLLSFFSLLHMSKAGYNRSLTVTSYAHSQRDGFATPWISHS